MHSEINFIHDKLHTGQGYWDIEKVLNLDTLNVSKFMLIHPKMVTFL